MKGWQLTFNIAEPDLAIRIELTGTQAAIQRALGVAKLSAGAAIQKRLAKGHVPPGLLDDALRLDAIQRGGQLEAYNGPFLTIAQVAKVDGLRSHISVEWA
jgi:hypothetical protein